MTSGDEQSGRGLPDKVLSVLRGGRITWLDNNGRWRFSLHDLTVDVTPYYDERGAVAVSEVRVAAPDGVTTTELRQVRLGEIVALIAGCLEPYRHAGTARAATRRFRTLDGFNAEPVEWVDIPGPALPPEEVFAKAEAYLGFLLDPGEPSEQLKLDVPRRTGRSYSDDFYSQVARAWWLCTTLGIPPARTLADANDVPESTVSAWIKGARNRGLLAKTRRRN